MEGHWGGELIAFTRSAPPQEALWPLCAIVAMCCLLLLKCGGLKCATRRPRRKEERSPPCCRPTPREVTGRIQFEESSVCGGEKRLAGEKNATPTIRQHVSSVHVSSVQLEPPKAGKAALGKIRRREVNHVAQVFFKKSTARQKRHARVCTHALAIASRSLASAVSTLDALSTHRQASDIDV